MIVVILSAAAAYALWKLFQSSVEFTSQQHRSLIVKNDGTPICRNEAVQLSFKKFAEGFFRFDFIDAPPNQRFFLRCFLPQKPEPFFEQTLDSMYELVFFVPNLPYLEQIRLEFGAESESPSPTLTMLIQIAKIRGIYITSVNLKNNTLDKDAVGEFPEPKSIVAAFDTPVALQFGGPTTIFTISKDNEITLSQLQLPNMFYIDNKGQSRVLQLQLINPDEALPLDDRSMLFTVVVKANVSTLFYLVELEHFWKEAYKRSTGKTYNSEANLQLHHVQQIIYS
ncbi:MAG TPA: hypothetical protein VHK67_04515 [Rhabdochlamydiaceae bacterium]|nr:hypothetical protein [Rhabdochlamydiaceae bacterium]